jgi:hypothetical protein
VLRVIRDAVPAETLPDVFSPLPHVGFEIRRLKDHRRLLAFLNYADRPVRGITVTVSGTQATPDSVTSFSSTGAEQSLSCHGLPGDRMRFALPPLEADRFVVLPAAR